MYLKRIIIMNIDNELDENINIMADRLKCVIKSCLQIYMMSTNSL